MEISTILNILSTGLLRGGLFALTAIGLSLVLGVMNIPNFAHGEFSMIGAYAASFLLLAGLAPHWVILLTAVVCLAAGVIMEKAMIFPLWKRNREDWVNNTFLLTAGLSFVLMNAAQAIWGAEYFGTESFWKGSLHLGSIGVSYDRVIGFLIAVVAIVGFWLFLQRTHTGRAIRAASQSEPGALLVGINLERIRTLTFALSCMLAGLAGAILLPINPAFPTMGQMWLTKSWFVVILVGLGNIPAAIVGGFLVGLLEATSYYFLSAGWQQVLSLSILTLVLAVKPSGLFGSTVKGVMER